MDMAFARALLAGTLMYFISTNDDVRLFRYTHVRPSEAQDHLVPGWDASMDALYGQRNRNL